ncbi:peptide MFS transporter [Gandjariella thermophila]|uniref:MFS transporter n=1 Tax=Gandjariella thermophila TaxID=1931992 RepID=A0A4D4J1Y5_9PSEU|nr:peptide MFS transporter [Gandjariella thermophila]GDY28639.1 MFS transporter [Gandjariella thermophila]
MTATASTPTAPQKGFFGHPRGLSTLFFTEMWERLSYYGMKSILLYYMYDQVVKGGLGIPSGTAKALVAVYGAALYMSGIVGGWVADRLLGSRRSILYGGILIMFAHICLAVPAGRGALYASMVLLVLGTGLLKTNISNTVGGLYDKQDTRRDAGFSIFYMGVNTGAFLAPFIVGTLGQKVNYHAGFSVAAVGMAIGLIQYVLGQRHLGDAGRLPTNPLTPAERGRFSLIAGAGVAALVVLVVVLAVTGVLTADLVINVITALSVLVPLGYFAVMLRSGRTTAVERSRVVAYIPLFVASVAFWFIQEQGASVLAQYADQRTDLNAFGFAIPSSWFQSVNPVVIIVLAPAFAALWMKLGTRQPTTPRKFAYGLLLAGLSYLVLVVPAVVAGTGVKANPLWLTVSFVLVTLGELCLSPVGLSATTKLAPAAFAAQTMGLWFTSDAAAQGLSAQVVKLYTPATEAGYFGVVGGVVLVLGVALYLIAPAIHRKMQGVD